MYVKPGGLPYSLIFFAHDHVHTYTETCTYTWDAGKKMSGKKRNGVSEREISVAMKLLSRCYKKHHRFCSLPYLLSVNALIFSCYQRNSRQTLHGKFIDLQYFL